MVLHRDTLLEDWRVRSARCARARACLRSSVRRSARSSRPCSCCLAIHWARWCSAHARASSSWRWSRWTAAAPLARCAWPHSSSSSAQTRPDGDRDRASRKVLMACSFSRGRSVPAQVPRDAGRGCTQGCGDRRLGAAPRRGNRPRPFAARSRTRTRPSAGPGSRPACPAAPGLCRRPVPGRHRIRTLLAPAMPRATATGRGHSLYS